MGQGAALGSTIGVEVGTDGTVYVADHLNTQVVAFSPEGRLLWRTGRRGRGPGEFQLPYRIAVRSDGSVLVLDRSTGEISAISSAGAFLTRFRLPFSFSQIDDLVALPDGQLVIAGTTDGSEAARGRALHRFRVSGQRLVHAASFGPLPEARDPAVLRHWGAGPVQRVASGDLVYVQRIPYDIHRFEPGGRRRATIRPPFRTRGTPDDAIHIERADGGMTISTTDAEVERPGTVVELNRWLLVTRLSGPATHWDLYSPSGGYGCINAPGANTACMATVLRCSTQECKNVLLTDAQGNLLALADACQDELVVRALPTVQAVPFGASASLPVGTFQPLRSEHVSAALAGLF